MKHYFTNNEDLKSKPKEIRAYFGVYDFVFTTDIGVFSKDSVDYGTRVLLDHFKPVGKRILDVGCGYGPIGVVLGKLNPDIRIDMVDINDRAILLAEQNAARNKVTNVTIFHSHLFEQVQGTYSGIISNPPIRAGKHIVHAIVDSSYDHLQIGGELWMVIQKKQGAPSLKEKMHKVFQNVEVVGKDKGYYVLKSIK